MKKHLKKILALTFILTLCTTTMLSGTLAKYVSKESGTATVTAAQFKLNLTDDDSVTEGVQFAISETYEDVYDTGVNLYPGSEGNFDINIALVSDVDATITLDSAVSLVDSNGAALTNATKSKLNATGLRFCVDKDGTQYASSASCVTSYSDLDDAIEAITYDYDAVDDAGDSQTVKIYWYWAIDGYDVTDTAWGNAVAADVAAGAISVDIKFDIDVTATQVAPEDVA